MADMDLQIKIEALSAQAQQVFEGITKSIDDIGEATKKASKELNGFEKAAKSLKNVGDSLDKVGKKTKEIGKNLSLYVTAPLVAIGALAVNEFSEAETATNKLNQSLAASGRYSKAASDGMNAYAKQLQSVSIYSDDSVISSLALANIFTKTNEETKKLVDASAELASFTGIDLDTAVRLLGNSLNGNVGRLAMYVKGVDKLTETQLKSGDAITMTANIMKGQAAAAAQSLGGQITILKNELTSFLQKIGQDMAPVITKLIGYTRDLIKSFNELDPSTRKLIIIFAGIAAAIGPITVAVGTFIRSLGAIAGVLSPLMPVIGKIVSLFSGWTTAIVIVVAAVAGLTNIFLDLKKVGVDAATALSLVWDLITGAIEQKALPAVHKFSEGFYRVLSKLPGQVGEIFGQIADKQKQGAEDLANNTSFDNAQAAINEKLAALGITAGDSFTFGLSDGIGKAIGEMKGFFDTVGSGIRKPIVDNVAAAAVEVNWLTDFLKQKSQEILMTISGNLAGGFLDFVEGTKSASEAFAAFARQTIRYITQMILQQAIFNALSGLGGATAMAGSAGGGATGLLGANTTFAKGGLAKFADGGSVSGPGSGTSDSIMARISNGEFIVRAAAVKSVGTNFLNAINSMGGRSRMPAFADGGLAGSGGGQGSIVIENKGTPKESTGSQYDPQTGVTTILLEDINKNGPISKSLQSNFGFKRGGFR